MNRVVEIAPKTNVKSNPLQQLSDKSYFDRRYFYYVSASDGGESLQSRIRNGIVGFKKIFYGELQKEMSSFDKKIFSTLGSKG